MKGTVLVVDDDREMVKTLCDVLRVHGWDTAAAYSGEAAIEMALARTFTAILMDVRMGGVSGVEAFRAIRRAQVNVPVVLMTAYAARELLAQAESEGVLSLLHKPVHWPTLMDVLERAVQGPGNILIVDDDVDFLDTLNGVLAKAGHPSLKARTIDEALHLIEQRAPGVVILDLKLDHVKPYVAALAIMELNPTTILIL